MKQQTLTPQTERQRKLMLVLPLIILPFLTLLFWALGGGKASLANAQTANAKGFNSRLPDARLKNDSALNKMGYYDRAAQDSDKLKQQMKNDPYYKARRDTDTTNLHFSPMGIKPDKPGSKLIGPAGDPAASEAKIYEKLAALQKTIDKPEAKPERPVVPVPDYSAPVQSPPVTEDPQLAQMNSMLERIMDIQHPERVKEQAEKSVPEVPSKFRAIPAVIDGKQKITEGSVVRLKLMDTVTLSGQLLQKGQLIFGKGMLYNQRLTLNLKIIRIGNTILPVDLTVFDMTDGLEGINVPEAITGDAVRDGAASGIQDVQFMSLDPSMTTQLAGAGLNTAKSLFSKKVKRIKAKLKDGHKLLLRDNKRNQIIH